MKSSRLELSRRDLLQIDGLGMLGITLPQLLQAETRPRSCIFEVQYGRASHIDSLDLKPKAPA